MSDNNGDKDNAVIMPIDPRLTEIAKYVKNKCADILVELATHSIDSVKLNGNEIAACTQMIAYTLMLCTIDVMKIQQPSNLKRRVRYIRSFLTILGLELSQREQMDILIKIVGANYKYPRKPVV